MILAAADLTGWWVAWAITGVLVIVVAALVLIVIRTALAIAHMARDATETIALARDRTNAMWQVSTTNAVAKSILEGAVEARRALGGDVEEPGVRRGQYAPEAHATGKRAEARSAVDHSLPTGPQIDRDETL